LKIKNIISFATAKKDKEEYFSGPIINKPLYKVDFERYEKIIQVPYGLQFLMSEDNSYIYGKS